MYECPLCMSFIERFDAPDRYWDHLEKKHGTTEKHLCIYADEHGIHDSLWLRIMNINLLYNDNNWKYDSIESWCTDILSEIGEMANDIKHFLGRGSQPYTSDERKKIFEKIPVEIFDVYVYIVLGIESFFSEKTFIEAGKDKIKIIKARFIEKTNQQSITNNTP